MTAGKGHEGKRSWVKLVNQETEYVNQFCYMRSIIMKCSRHLSEVAFTKQQMNMLIQFHTDFKVKLAFVGSSLL